jgi:hypothetical protein
VDAEYVVFEYYCDNAECNCQHLIADIIEIGDSHEPIGKSQAVIQYDWSHK